MMRFKHTRIKGETELSKHDRTKPVLTEQMFLSLEARHGKTANSRMI
jgi:hypothetical protein